MLNKRAELTTKEIIEIVLVAAGIFVIVVLLYNLITPGYNVGDKTSESYLSTFVGQISVADSGAKGEFSMWQEDKKRKFYLVYFGGKSSYVASELRFFSFGDDENNVCICYLEDGETACNACTGLSYPLSFVDAGEFGSFAIAEKESIEINKGEDVYEIVRV